MFNVNIYIITRPILNLVDDNYDDNEQINHQIKQANRCQNENQSYLPIFSINIHPDNVHGHDQN